MDQMDKYAEAGKYKTQSVKTELFDSTRQRQIPVKVYMPVERCEPAPLIMFSHGMGCSRDDYEYLGRHWASHGYICLHVQHIGSDTQVWDLRAMRASARSKTDTFNRPADISFVLDELLSGSK